MLAKDDALKEMLKSSLDTNIILNIEDTIIANIKKHKEKEASKNILFSAIFILISAALYPFVINTFIGTNNHLTNITVSVIIIGFILYLLDNLLLEHRSITTKPDTS